MELAVTDVHFMCDGRWFVQVDGVAMGSTLSVILANIWMHGFEKAIAADVPVITGIMPWSPFFRVVAAGKTYYTGMRSVAIFAINGFTEIVWV